MKARTILTTISGTKHRLAEDPEQVLRRMLAAAGGPTGGTPGQRASRPTAGVFQVIALDGQGKPKRLLVPLTSVDTIGEA